MKMNDDFEQKLSRQPLRQVPTEWREEILTVANEVGTARRAVRGRLGEASLPNWLSTLNSQLSTLLWPHPKAWAGLAAVWILIFAVDFSVQDKSPVMAGKSVPPSPEVIVELKQQQRLLAELMGPRDKSDADGSKSFVPQPRSEQRFEIMAT
jgi:hypothetical protein